MPVLGLFVEAARPVELWAADVSCFDTRRRRWRRREGGPLCLVGVHPPRVAEAPWASCCRLVVLRAETALGTSSKNKMAAG